MYYALLLSLCLPKVIVPLAIQPGMTNSQVKAILGSPNIVVLFHWYTPSSSGLSLTQHYYDWGVMVSFDGWDNSKVKEVHRWFEPTKSVKELWEELETNLKPPAPPTFPGSPMSNSPPAIPSSIRSPQSVPVPHPSRRSVRYRVRIAPESSSRCCGRVFYREPH